MDQAVAVPLIWHDERTLRIRQWLDSDRVLLSVEEEDWLLDPNTGSMQPLAEE